MHNIMLKIYNYYNQLNHINDNYYYHLFQMHNIRSCSDRIMWYSSRLGSKGLMMYIVDKFRLKEDIIPNKPGIQYRYIIGNKKKPMRIFYKYV